jgi:hypothetical protein
LVVAHHGITVIADAAANAEAGKDRVVRDGAIEQLAFFRKDGHVPVQDFEDVVGADRQTNVNASASPAAGKPLA